MEQNNSSPAGAIFGIFSKLGMQQKMMLGGIAVITVVMLIFVVFIFNEPSYSVLFTNLPQDDASKVVEYLTSSKIPFKLEDEGQTIKVPKDKVYETRLSLAGKGIPNSGVVGYEIFDNNTLGMSDFMQKLNYKRALEGELSKTIKQQNGIEGVRVHIVFPEKAIFKNDQKKPTASVVLKLGLGVKLSESNAEAIANLVSSSIEGMDPENVTILDTRGQLLSREKDSDPLAMSSGKQYEMKASIENYLANKAQSMLDNVLGYGNSIVKVNVDLDFKQVEKTMESYDPESQVAISEQTIKSASGGKSITDSNTVVSENSTTNYEISKSIERIVEGSGNIKRVTLAAVVNDIVKTTGEGEERKTVTEPRSEEELRKLENIVKQSVGYNADRRDEISVIGIPFEVNNFDDVQDEVIAGPLDQFQKYSNFILILIGIGAGIIVLRGLMNKLKNEKIVVGTVGGFKDEAFADVSPDVQALTAPAKPVVKRKDSMNLGDIEDEITDEAQRRKMQHERIINYVQKNPSDAAKLINGWLREDEY